MNSIWSDVTNPVSIKPLEHSISVDAAVIGGGLAGILTAYQLKNSGMRTAVFEKDMLGEGVTANTTGKITSQHGLIYDRLLRKAGEKTSRQYAQYNEQAIRQYRSIIKKENISCDFESISASLYDLHCTAELQKEVRAAKKLGIRAEFIPSPSLPFQTAGAAVFHGQAQFHPLKFLYALSRNLEIYQKTKALGIDQNTISVLNVMNGKTYEVKAKHIVIATHYPFINFPGMYFLRMYQSCSYVLALKNAKVMDSMYIGTNPSDFSLRNYKDILLFGGRGHRTGDIPKQNPYTMLRQAAKAFFPQSVEIGRWSAQDCMPLRQVPYIGKYFWKKNPVYVASGFQKWGMTSSMTAATILSSQIRNEATASGRIFSPGNLSVHAPVIPALKNTADNLKNLLKPDKAPRCSHMGCSLTWNPFEQTWDCPCHGSKFDKKGRIIRNPAQKHLTL